MKKIYLIILLTIAGFNLKAQPTWNQKTDFPACSYDGVCFAVNDKVYYGLGILCGGSETNNFYQYDPMTDLWTSITSFPGPTRRKASAFSINGKGYVCLGYSSGTELQDLWEYDPVADTWTSKNDFPGVPRGAAFADVVNNKAYVGTGFAPMHGGYPMDLWEYDASTDSWNIKDTMPGIALYESKSFAIGDTLYVVGGVGGALLLEHNEVWAYSTTANTWIQKPDFPGGTPRWYATTFSLNGIGYCGYGFLSASNYLSDFYSYTPSAGWLAIASNGLGMLFNGGGGGVSTSNAGYGINGVTSANPNPITSDMWEFIPEPTTVVNEIINEEDFNVYYNSSSNTLNIKSGNESKIVQDIKIMNALGEEVLFMQIYQGENLVDVSGFSNGIYIISKQTNKNHLISRKVFINKHK
jgi:hypothetical protein